MHEIIWIVLKYHEILFDAFFFASETKTNELLF